MKIRQTILSDSALILQLIRELAHYERLGDEVVVTVDELQQTLFCELTKAEVLLMDVECETGGFELFFQNYSTFLCKYWIYIEDIYVRMEYRGNEYGKALLKYICQLAVERDCGRVELLCLDWNKQSIDFYLKLVAEAMSDLTLYRLDHKTIEK
jgi:GNAT superfamily N-acetyltransferase